MRALKKITFVIDAFGLQTPAQQLLDRFLIGYPRAGEFHRLEGCQVVCCPSGVSGAEELRRRAGDFGLRLEDDGEDALSGADGVVVVGNEFERSGVRAELDKILESTPNGCPCFVYGPLGANLAGAQGVADLAAERRLPLLNGTPLPVTWRLPEVDLEMGTPLSEALIVVQGPEGWAELHALDGLLPVIERRRNGESGVRAIHALRGDAVWQASENGLWSPALLAAAISRSNSPQGDPVKDGRTQDLAGLGLVPKLARAPRGWILDHADGLRSTLLVLDGVVADFNFAVRTRAGEIVSAQLYRPPAPPDHQFSRLAEVIEEFFRKGHPPWPIDRSRLESGLLGRFRELGGQRGQSKPISTPELQIAYAIP